MGKEGDRGRQFTSKLLAGGEAEGAAQPAAAAHAKIAALAAAGPRHEWQHPFQRSLLAAHLGHQDTDGHGQLEPAGRAERAGAQPGKVQVHSILLQCQHGCAVWGHRMQ